MRAAAGDVVAPWQAPTPDLQEHCICASPLHGAVPRAEDTHHLLTGCTAPVSPPCPCKLVLSQSVTSCSSPRTPALLAELILL